MSRLDSTGDTLNSTFSSDAFEDSFGSSCEESEHLGFSIDIDIPDGRLSCPEIKRTILQVTPLEGASDHFTLRLVTNHHSFSLGRSVAIRTINSLYYLQVILLRSSNKISFTYNENDQNRFSLSNFTNCQ